MRIAWLPGIAGDGHEFSEDATPINAGGPVVPLADCRGEFLTVSHAYLPFHVACSHRTIRWVANYVRQRVGLRSKTTELMRHLQYYRQEAINARSGFHTPSSTLAAWAGQAGAALEPLY